VTRQGSGGNAGAVKEETSMGHEDETGDSLASNRTVNIVVALVLIAVGGLVIADSLRLGIGWASDGPSPGYFPFYTGLLIMLSSLCTIILTLMGRMGSNEPFVRHEQFRYVMKVFVPTVVYVGLIGLIGIYVASVLFIALFMRLLGRFRWHVTILVSLAVPFALFVIFELWFLLPLPKGPVEDLLGY
jgi:putative tricarboxylic transport membrane protein